MVDENELELKFDKCYWDSVKKGSSDLDKWFAGKRKWEGYISGKEKLNSNEKEKLIAEANKYDFYQTEKRLGYSPPYIYGPDLPPGSITVKITAYLPPFYDVHIVGAEVIYHEKMKAYKQKKSPKYYLKVFMIKLKKNLNNINIKVSVNGQNFDDFKIKIRN